MTQRDDTLATAFERVLGQILTVVNGLSDATWETVPAGEARTVGQIAYHMAEIYDEFNGYIQMALANQPLPSLNVDIVRGANAEQAERYANADRLGAREMLHQNGTAVAALLRSLSDAQLDTTIHFFGQTMTLESLAENGLVRHTEEHLASIQRATAGA